MAFADVDHDGDLFANLNNQVGATGNWDDMMVVQGLLQLYWMGDVSARRIVPSKPIVDGAAHKETVLLIKHFQQHRLKRPKPQGFVNPAKAADKSPSTIWQLNQQGAMIIAGLGITPRQSIDWLAATFPKLAGPFRPPRATPIQVVP